MRYLLLVLLVLVSPVLAQSSLSVRRELAQAQELIDSKEPARALEILAEGLQTLRALKLEVSVLAAEHHLARAHAYDLLGDDAGAIAGFENALKTYGEQGPEQTEKYRQTLLEFGDRQRKHKQNEKAIALYRQALALEPPAGRAETGRLLHNLASAYREEGALDQAFEIFSQALDIKEQSPIADEASLATTLSEFGGVCRLLGRFEQAERYLSRALEIRKADRESSPESYALALNNLGLVKQSRGAHREALELIRESYAIYSQVYGLDHPEMISTRANLAASYGALGEFEKAEQHYREALNGAHKHFGPDSLETARVSHNLGVLLLEMKDFEKSRAHLEQALAIRRRQLSTNHQELVANLINLASLQREVGNDEEALLLYQEALSTAEKALGPDHSELAYTLDLMAGIPSLDRDSKEVLAWTERAYEIRRKALGPKAALTAYSLHSLGLLSHHRGDLEKAREQFQQTREIFVRELGPKHAFSGKASYRLGVLAWEKGDQEEALTYAQEQAASFQATTEEVFSFGSERQRLAYAAQLRPYDLAAALGAAELLATEVLRYKGAVLDSIMEDLSLARQSNDPERRERVEALLRVREQLSNLLGTSGEAPRAGLEPAHKDPKKVAALREELETLEAAVARDGSGSGEIRRIFRVTPEQVSKALPPGTVLIEQVKYGRLLEWGEIQESYGAVTLAPNREPVWTHLGSAQEIEGLSWHYLRLVRGLPVGEGNDNPLRSLYHKVWAPLEKTLPDGTTTVIISPDAVLNFVSLATLLDPNDQFLGQRYDLVYVASGRDLLRQPSPGARGEAVLLGDPDF
ncbi:MAG: tetratricopeptide repeat protein, partial [Vulcanimicrobiota bacterium]